MKVVLFCEGLGTRLRDYSDQIPKPLVEIGSRPILWHLMRCYAHYGHTEFILCLGYRGSAIKSYFRTYDECLSNDFVLQRGGREIELLQKDIDSWKITFVDTGQARTSASACGACASTWNPTRCSWPTTRTGSPTSTARATSIRS